VRTSANELSMKNKLRVHEACNMEIIAKKTKENPNDVSVAFECPTLA